MHVEFEGHVMAVFDEDSSCNIFRLGLDSETQGLAWIDLDDRSWPLTELPDIAGVVLNGLTSMYPGDPQGALNFMLENK